MHKTFSINIVGMIITMWSACGFLFWGGGGGGGKGVGGNEINK